MKSDGLIKRLMFSVFLLACSFLDRERFNVGSTFVWHANKINNVRTRNSETILPHGEVGAAKVVCTKIACPSTVGYFSLFYFRAQCWSRSCGLKWGAIFVMFVKLLEPIETRFQVKTYITGQCTMVCVFKTSAFIFKAMSENRHHSVIKC